MTLHQRRGGCRLLDACEIVEPLRKQLRQEQSKIRLLLDAVHKVDIGNLDQLTRRICDHVGAADFLQKEGQTCASCVDSRARTGLR